MSLIAIIGAGPAGGALAHKLAGRGRVGGAAGSGGGAALALLRQLAGFERRSPLVCVGAGQRELIARGVGELHIAPSRIIGSAPFALESALRAISGLMVDGSGVEVSLRVVGVPPKSAVVAWEEAAAFGQPLASQMPPHQIAALSARIPGLWPPGPYALASAGARGVGPLAAGG